ncbi:hypothetical protein M5K25_010838 [Dendrobium thyrsiflorum]|uniref:Uncharacterized protein n=1 Tax=Dendrobium thyrsiflorum TaxID=117978 RepID=A0ABD0V8D3_DENTH
MQPASSRGCFRQKCRNFLSDWKGKSRKERSRRQQGRRRSVRKSEVGRRRRRRKKLAEEGKLPSQPASSVYNPITEDLALSHNLSSDPNGQYCIISPRLHRGSKHGKRAMELSIPSNQPEMILITLQMASSPSLQSRRHGSKSSNLMRYLNHSFVDPNMHLIHIPPI